MRALSHYWRVTRPDNMVAQALLEKAIAIDPNYGQALSVLATSHMFGVHSGWADVRSAAPIAERAALAAVEADSEDPWAHNALGSVYFSTRRLDDSLAEFELALQLNPNFSLAQGYYGLALSYTGRWQEAYEAALEAGRRPRALSGSLSPRGLGLASLLLRGDHPVDPEPAFRWCIGMARPSESHWLEGFRRDRVPAWQSQTLQAGPTITAGGSIRSCAACSILIFTSY
jgi:tetratricopeptide (TPR) repeat protein